MLQIRLSRTGRTGQPSFRIVLMDKRGSPKGKALSLLGHFQPALKEKPAVLNKEQILHWISKGAKPSPSVASLLKKNGMENMDRFLIMRERKRKKKGEASEEKTPAAKPEATAKEEKPEEKSAPAPAPKAEEENAKTSQ